MTVSGKFTAGAKLTVDKTVSVSDYNAVISSIDAGKETVIGQFEVKVTGSYEGELKLAFEIGSEYDGKMITVYHRLASGEIEVQTALCVSGKVSVTVTELSPFVLTAEEEPSISIWLYAAVGVVAVILIGTVIAVVSYKKKKEN